MDNSEKQRSADDREIEGMDRVDGANDLDDLNSTETSTIETSANSRCSGVASGSRLGVALTERLTDILVDERDADLLLQQSGRRDNVLQFLQALDLQVMGACRADERLKPMLKLNVSCDAAEDRLLAYLSQHFEPSEVALLARCLCIPLVSIRVGKINKQGNLLCPTSTRGNLILTLLPTSDLRISFIGDNGHAERLSTLGRNSQCSDVTVEDIPSDKSGRSFLLRMPENEVFYFWCSEKSKLLGNELISKMKDLIGRKPSLAELTGISGSRLDSFATHLRAHLVGTSVTHRKAVSGVGLFPSDASSDFSEPCQNAESSYSTSSSSKPLRNRHFGNQSGKSNSLYQGSLSPRSSSFKDGLPRNLSSLRTVVREKLRRQYSQISAGDNLSVASPLGTDSCSAHQLEKDKLLEAAGNHLLESLEQSAALPSFLSPASQVPSVASSLLSPYYCWCPPIASTLQYSGAPTKLPIITSTESLSLPPLSTLLPSTRSSSVLMPTPPLDVANIPPLDFPPLLPEPLVRLPLSRSSSQQIATFTPLMCDPIVHIPVIDVCSSGQGYLVSAGPTISTTISPLHSKLVVNPLIPETNSVEEGARETLRLLIGSSSQSSPPLMDVLPSVLTQPGEKQSVLAVGSRGLYTGTRDVSAIANSIAAMGLASISAEKSVSGSAEKCIGLDNLADQVDESDGASGFCSDDEGSKA
ncbi:hypothetical protein NMG60_11011897 [Bertholletia excelsa]